jgi:hypothetical protein
MIKILTLWSAAHKVYLSNFRVGPGSGWTGKILIILCWKNLAHDIPLDKSGLAFSGWARAASGLGEATRVIYTTK